MNDTRSERRYTAEASDGDGLGKRYSTGGAQLGADEHLDMMETLGGENERDYWVRIESKPENTD